MNLVERALEMRRNGMTLRAIARILGVSRDKALRWTREVGMNRKFPPAPPLCDTCGGKNPPATNLSAPPNTCSQNCRSFKSRHLRRGLSMEEVQDLHRLFRERARPCDVCGSALNPTNKGTTHDACLVNEPKPVKIPKASRVFVKTVVKNCASCKHAQTIPNHNGFVCGLSQARYCLSLDSKEPKLWEA